MSKFDKGVILLGLILLLTIVGSSMYEDYHRHSVSLCNCGKICNVKSHCGLKECKEMK